MTTDLFNQKNEKVGTVELPDRVFKVKWNPTLVHQALVAQLSNARNSTAHTKDRSEVRGGGKKPWRQKHTGRARHGSIRSPLWRGGGATFGPRNERLYEKKINKKMKRQALCVLLSKKITEDRVRVIDDISFSTAKTSQATAMLKYFFKQKPNALLVVPRTEKSVFLAARNIPRVDVLDVTSLNVHECLSHDYILFDRESVEEMTQVRA